MVPSFPMLSRPPPALVPSRGTAREASANSMKQLENGRTERQRCHTAVTTRCGSGELARDGLRRFRLVRPFRESLRDKQIQARSDWGSSVGFPARFCEGAALVGLADFDVKVALALHADAASPCTTIPAGCMPFATATASSSLVRISVARACFLTDRAS
jgi:hypothetical protein